MHFFRSVLLPICLNPHFMFITFQRCESNTCSILQYVYLLPMQYLFYINNMFIYYQWYDFWPFNANALLSNITKLYMLYSVFL